MLHASIYIRYLESSNLWRPIVEGVRDVRDRGERERNEEWYSGYRSSFEIDEKLLVNGSDGCTAM